MGILTSDSPNFVCDEIIETYISPHALPLEEIRSWIRWKEKFQFDKLILRTPEDVFVEVMLDVDDEVFKNTDPRSRKFEINKDWIQVNGFFGFHAKYTKIPDRENTLTFFVEFISNNEKVSQIELNTQIIIPDLILQPVSDNELIINEFQKNIHLAFSLKTLGKAIPKNVTGMINISSGGGKGLEIKITTEKSPNKNPFIPITAKQLITISGTGYALITLGFEYEDYNQNKYKTNSLEFVINKQVKEQTTIPISSKIENMPLLLVEA